MNFFNCSLRMTEVEQTEVASCFAETLTKMWWRSAKNRQTVDMLFIRLKLLIALLQISVKFQRNRENLITCSESFPVRSRSLRDCFDSLRKPQVIHLPTNLSCSENFFHRTNFRYPLAAEKSQLSWFSSTKRQRECRERKLVQSRRD